MCDPYVKEELFLMSQLFHSPLADISNLALLSAVLTFLSKLFSLIGRSVGKVWTSLQTSLIICVSDSHWVVLLMRWGSPGGICAKLCTVTASNNRVHMPWSVMTLL